MPVLITAGVDDSNWAEFTVAGVPRAVFPFTAATEDTPPDDLQIQIAYKDNAGHYMIIFSGNWAGMQDRNLAVVAATYAVRRLRSDIACGIEVTGVNP